MKKIMELPSSVKLIIGALTFLIAIATGVIAVDDRYVSSEEAASSLEMFDQKVQYELKDLKKEVLRSDLDYVTARYFRLKALAANNPQDSELRAELEEINIKRNSLKKLLGE